MKTFCVSKKLAVISALLFCVTLSYATPWEIVASLNQPRGRIAAAVLDGVIYAIGGNTVPGTIFDVVEKFDPDSGVWVEVAPLNHPRTYAAAAAANGYVYVFGGRIDAATPEPHVERYDPYSDEWIDVTEMTAPLTPPREGLQAITVGDEIWVIGGYTTATGYIGNVDVFDPMTETFTGQLISVGPRVGHAAVVKGNIIRVLGGVYFSVLDEHLSFQDPLWVNKEPMQDARLDLAAAIVGDSLLAIGGSNGSEPYNTVECYRFSTGTWSYADPMNYYRETHAAVDLDGDIYVIGGYGGDGIRHEYLSSVEMLPWCPATFLSDEKTLYPQRFDMKCYPNPFNSQLSIIINSDNTDLNNSELSIFNSIGQIVYNFDSGDIRTGAASLIWEGTDNFGNELSSGLYYVILGGTLTNEIKPIVLLR